MRDNGIKTLKIKNPEEEIEVEFFPREYEEKNGLLPEEGYHIITSSVTGVGYLKPADQAETFISVGDRVKKGDVLCIIEVMKVMNEIVADSDCEICEICFENGEVIEYGQTLFKLKKGS